MKTFITILLLLCLENAFPVQQKSMKDSSWILGACRNLHFMIGYSYNKDHNFEHCFIFLNLQTPRHEMRTIIA